MWINFLLSVLISGISCYDDSHFVKLDWWESSAIYQIYVRSFVDSDADGIGDIPGITARLDYLKDIGVDAVWLSPIYKTSNHDFGYDVIDYYAINPEYGNMEDFEELHQKATALNIKLILEFVPNHTSNESEWFVKSSHKDEYYSDWYIWADGYLEANGNRRPPNNWISTFGKSAWTYVPNRDQFYLHQYSERQPDLNYRNPVVVDEIKNIMKFWLEKGVAGLKLSSINHLFEVDKEYYGGRYPDEPPTGTPGVGADDYGFLYHVYTKDMKDIYHLIAQFREVFNTISVGNEFTRVLLTETSTTNIKNAVKYYGDDKNKGAHIPCNMAFIEDVTKSSDARDIKFYVDKWLTYKPLKKRANWVTGNHDTSRVASRFRPGLVDAFNILTLLLPGIAFTYMGEELGMQNGVVSWAQTKDPLACSTDDPVNYFEVSRDPVRTPFHWNNGKNAGFSAASKTWLPIAESFNTHMNVASQRSAVRSHFQLYRVLTALRRRAAFRIGRYESFALNKNVFAFKRWHKDDAYVIVINLSKKYNIVNLTAFDLIFGSLEVEASSVLSSRNFNDNVQANYLDLAADEALVLRMQV